MKTEKILIFADKNRQTDFENSVETAQSEANRLIELYHNFQPWNKIKTIEDFEALCSDPIKAMDQTLITNSGINLEATGGRLPAPEMVAKLLDIDRENFTNIVKGQKIEPGSCKSCGKLKIVQSGKGVLNYSTFQKYQEYLLFNEGRFSINEDAVELKKESFKVYASTPEEIKCYNFWQNTCETLNSLSKKGYLGNSDLDNLSKLLKGRLSFSFQTNRLGIELPALLYEISQLKK